MTPEEANIVAARVVEEFVKRYSVACHVCRTIAEATNACVEMKRRGAGWVILGTMSFGEASRIIAEKTTEEWFRAKDECPEYAEAEWRKGQEAYEEQEREGSGKYASPMTHCYGANIAVMTNRQ